MNIQHRWHHLIAPTSRLIVLCCLTFLACTPLGCTSAQETPQAPTNEQRTSSEAEEPSVASQEPAAAPANLDKDELLDPPPSTPTIDIPKTWIRLSPKEEIWLDRKKKQVIVGGEICLAAGQLEMFICPPQTKLHESIVVADCQSWQVHAALIAIGAAPGETAKWAPEYQPAWGPKIEIEMIWRDEASGQIKRADAKQWIQNIDTEKAMKADWVFGGSIMEKNPETGENVYLGNFGELVCLSNFSTATIDLNIESSEHETLFVAFEKNIPPVGTQVYAVFKPGAILGKPKQARPPKKNSAKRQTASTSALAPNEASAADESVSTEEPSVHKAQQ